MFHYWATKVDVISSSWNGSTLSSLMLTIQVYSKGFVFWGKHVTGCKLQDAGTGTRTQSSQQSPKSKALHAWMECWPLYTKCMEEHRWLDADIALRNACKLTGLSCESVAECVPEIAERLTSHVALMRDVDMFRDELDNMDGYVKASEEPLQVCSS